MKKVLYKIVSIALLLFLAAGVFFSCEKKDPKYDAVITVKYESDTFQVVKNAYVLIEKNDVRVSGMTDASGQFAYTFKREAILNVHAQIDTSTTGIPVILLGNSTIRLVEDETVRRTVFIHL